MLDRFQVSAADIPVVICRGSLVLRNSTNQQIAECLGFNQAIDQRQVRDLVIVGAALLGSLQVCTVRQKGRMFWFWNRRCPAVKPPVLGSIDLLWFKTFPALTMLA
ncbi:MAG: hypothetical protein EHM23_32745 [Acidobacteria bacterium]|nr:MAG: hypothetical protein EHM23_32745 [Acidobacteriota bacterium]